VTERQASRSGGFTLVEILVALAILGLTFGLAFNALSGGFDWLGRTGSQQRAVTIAETTLARVGHDIVLRDGRQQGSDADGYRWEVEVAPYGNTGDTAIGRLIGHLVSVTVTWRDLRLTRSVHLTGLRLAPQAPAS
jgi:general secretion pathway protein I